MGKQAAAIILSKYGIPFWQIHGMGLDSEMVPGRVLKAGMVICLEPMFTVEGQGFFLEDMILIKHDGYEVLTNGLPYSADEIERAVRNRGLR
jgi:Xaa-Pro aminopeptidase